MALPTTTGPAHRLAEPSSSSPASRATRLVVPTGLALAVHAGLILLLVAISYLDRRPITHALFAWDAHWYLSIARTWYPATIPSGVGSAAQSNLGFFPLLPAAIRLVAFLPGVSIDSAGIVVTTLAGIAAAIAVFRLVLLDHGSRLATRATALVLCAPGAFVLSIVYGEGLLVALAAGSLVALRQRRWLLAGILAGLATATDPLGIAIIAPAVLASAVSIRHDRDYRSLVSVALAPAGVVGFFSYLWVRTGTPLAWLIAQRRGWEEGGFATGVWKALRDVAVGGLSNPNDTVKAASFLVTLVLLVAFLVTRPNPLLVAYVAAVLVLAFLSPVTGFSPRITLRAFPLLAVAGARLKRGWFEGVLGLSTLTMATLAVLALSTTTRIPFTP